MLQRWSWRNTVLTALGLAVVFGSPVPMASAAETEAAPSGPDLVVVEPAVDLGEVVKGNDVVHEFVLRNEGSEPLEIERVQSTCGCTVASFDQVVPPGGSGVVTAKLESLRLNGDGTVTLRVFSNDPDNPVENLELQYDVVSLIQVHPGYARWLYVQGEERATIGQTLWAADGEPFDVVGVETPGPHIEAEFRPASEEERQPDVDGRQWRVELTLDSWAPVGAIEKLAQVRINHPEQSVVPIPLSGFVRPILFVEPQQSDLGRIELDGVRRAVFNVRNFSSRSVEITEVDTGVEGIDFEVDTVEEGRRYRLELYFDPDQLPEGPFETTVRIETDYDKAPTLEVPLKGFLVDVRGGEESAR